MKIKVKPSILHTDFLFFRFFTQDRTGDDVSSWTDIEGNNPDYVNWLHLHEAYSGNQFRSGDAATYGNWGNSAHGLGLVTPLESSRSYNTVCVQEIVQSE